MVVGLEGRVTEREGPLDGGWSVFRPLPLAQLVQLVRSGQLDLRQFGVTAFAPDDIGKAVAHAATDHGGFRLTVAGEAGEAGEVGEVG